jgi:hypothetical protein
MLYTFGLSNATFAFEWGTGECLAVFGQNYFDIEDTNTLRQTARTTDEFPWPATFDIGHYRLVT